MSSLSDSALTLDWWENSDEGVWWHVLDQEGLRLFLNRSPEFGKITLAATEIDTSLKTERLIRFTFTRKVADKLLPIYKGATLVLDPKNLTTDEWVEYGPNRFRHVRATAVLRIGQIRTTFSDVNVTTP